MKKIIDLIADSGSNKDEKLLNYIRKNYLKNKSITNICFIYGQGSDWSHHKQPTAKELRKLVFETNAHDTLYFLASFYFDKDRENYLKLMEDICENDIQVFKTDQKYEHVTSDKSWTDRYCEFLSLKDLENR